MAKKLEENVRFEDATKRSEKSGLMIGGVGRCKTKWDLVLGSETTLLTSHVMEPLSHHHTHTDIHLSQQQHNLECSTLTDGGNVQETVHGLL